MRELQLDSGEALVVVAHPDDETIWMGGTILSCPNIKWTIVALCRASDRDRAPRFKKAIRALGAKRSIINDLEDEDLLNIRESGPEIKKILRRNFFTLGLKKYKYVFTHGSRGEYGHPRHKAVHKAVKEMILSKELKADSAYNFKYKAKGEFKFKAFPKILRKKLAIISEVYGFSKGSLEYAYGSYRPEKYSIIK